MRTISISDFSVPITRWVERYHESSRFVLRSPLFCPSPPLAAKCTKELLSYGRKSPGGGASINGAIIAESLVRYCVVLLLSRFLWYISKRFSTFCDSFSYI